MNILFICPREKPFNSKTVRELPCGGTEKAVIFLGEALQKLDHSVEWFTTSDQIQPTDHDVVITQEASLFELWPDAKKVWWVHHFTDQPVIQRNSGYGRAWADKIVTLSQCQKQDYLSTLRLDSVTIGHGIWLGEVQQAEKDPYRLIYASTPFRGLCRIPAIFKEIKKLEPRATIAICSSMATYGDTDGDKQYKSIFDELREIPGVELLGSLNQQQLYQEYANASIFFYPCTWPETYCLAMDEAIAHGCFPSVSRLGALPERVIPNEEDEFVEDVLTVFKHGNWAPVIQKPKDWLTIAKEWEEKVLND